MEREDKMIVTPDEALAIEEILSENTLRLQKKDERFDPISGEGAPGERFPCTLSKGDIAGIGYGHREIFLPVAMREEEIVKRIMKRSGTAGVVCTDEEIDLFDRLRCRHDFAYWAARYAYIKCKGGGADVRFNLNFPQRKMVNLFEQMRCAGRPIRVILLKARQWGGSTCSQLYMAWLQLTQKEGLNSLIIAHQSSGTEEIKDMYDRMIAAYPVRMLAEPGEKVKEDEKRTVAIGRSGASMKVIRRNCKIKIGTAERPDSCRGGDYNLVHLSEVGVWKKTLGKSPEDIVRSACSGVLNSADTMIVYESTANGTGNFFHREFEAARRGESQFTPLFVAWHEIERYSEDVEDVEGLALKLLRYRKEDYTQSDRREPGRYLWWLWEQGVTLQGISWYISERAKYNDHGQMASEFPSDSIEAFVHSGAAVFDRYNVEKFRDACCSPLATGEVDGRAPTGVKSLQQLQFNCDLCGSLSVWKFPEHDEHKLWSDRYLTVVDVGGRSARADWSVIVVFDRKPMATGGKPEVVAQWRGHCDIDLLTWRAARIAAYYNDSLLVIESNTLESRDSERNTEGDQSFFILNQIREVYPNIYARRQSEDDVIQGREVKYGFHTNISTKPMIISTLIKVIRESGYVERDERCLDEYLCYEKRENGSYGAIAGRHDDMLMTRAIGLHICYNEMELPRCRAKSDSVIVRRSGPLTEAEI